MEDLPHRNQEAAERQRRRRRRRRGRRLTSTVERQRQRQRQPPRGESASDATSFAIGPDGTRLFVHTRTAGHPPSAAHAVFSDGILCDGFIWKYAWTSVSEVAPVVHWHYRGHGRSAAPADPARIDIPAHAADLDAVRRHIGDPPCVLFGHSMGCQVALEAYRLRPEGVRGLVLVCGSFGHLTSTFHGLPLLELVLPSMLDVAQRMPEVVRALWSRLPAQLAMKIALKAGEIDPVRVRAEDFLPYLSHMTHVDFPMFLRMLRAAGAHSAGDLLEHIGVPVLVIAGERDTFTPPYLARAMAERIPGAELFIVPGGTHVAPIEQPELVNDRISGFLAERISSA